MTRNRWFVLLIVLAATLVVSGILVKENRSGSVQDLTIYGNVDIREVQLAFHSEGRIAAIYVEEGTQVEKGQLLAEVEPERYQAVVNQLQQEIAAQSAVVEKLHAGSRQQEIQKARAQARAIEAELTEAVKRLNRVRRLAKKQFASRQDLDAAQARVDTTRERLNAAMQSLRLLEIGPRKEDIVAAEARLKALEAKLALAEKNLADTKLYAPEKGIIRNRILQPGDMAAPSRPVLTLALQDPVWVRAYLPEPMLGRVKPGVAAFVTTDSYPGKRYKGWVGYISPTAEFTPRNVETPDLRTKLVYQVRVFVCNPENELRLGMPATVIISENDSSGAEGCQ